MNPLIHYHQIGSKELGIRLSNELDRTGITNMLVEGAYDPEYTHTLVYSGHREVLAAALLAIGEPITNQTPHDLQEVSRDHIYLTKLEKAFAKAGFRPYCEFGFQGKTATLTVHSITYDAFRNVRDRVRAQHVLDSQGAAN